MTQFKALCSGDLLWHGLVLCLEPNTRGGSCITYVMLDGRVATEVQTALGHRYVYFHTHQTLALEAP